MCSAATPAPSYACTVRRTLSALPYPVSASAISGISTAAEGAIGEQQGFAEQVRVAVGEVRRGQTNHGAEEASRVGRKGKREVGGLALDAAREGVDQRVGDEAQHAEHQGKPRQRAGIGH